MNDEPLNEGDDAGRGPEGGPQLMLAPEDRPNIDGLITEDNTPVDNLYVEKQRRLLTDPLYSSWAGPPDGSNYTAMTEVGLFFTNRKPALVPDFLLSIDVDLPEDIRDKESRSYFVWVYAKVPDVVLEIVSDRRGDEGSYKMREYGRQRIPYYVIFDPDDLLGEGVLRVLHLRDGSYRSVEGNWLPAVGLGLMLWQGTYEGADARWLRWCDRDGLPIPSGHERAEQERQRAEQAEQRAEQAEQRAEQEAERRKRLEAQLRALGIEPSA